MFQNIISAIANLFSRAIGFIATFRMLVWLAISLALTGIIFIVAPHQLETTVYKLSLITTAAWLGYWIDRSLFPYARPDKIYDDTFNANEMNLAAMRRAIIIAACVIGAALGA